MSKFAVLDKKSKLIHAVIEAQDMEKGLANFEAAADVCAKRGIDLDVYYLEHESFVPTENLLGFLLARARFEVGFAKLDIAAIQKRIDGILDLTGLADEFAIAKANVAQMKEVEGAAYTALTDEMVKAYGEDGTKKRAAGTVAVYTVYDYATGEALDYAMEHELRGCLSLKKKPFEKVVGALGGLDFVAVGEQPRARVKADLSELLG